VKRGYRSIRLVLFMVVLVGIAVIAMGCNGNGDKEKTYSVSGRVTARNTGLGVSGAVVSFGSYGTVTTDASGYWVKSGIKGTVTISVAKEGWRFEPSYIAVSSETSDVYFQGQELEYRGLTPKARWDYKVEQTLAGYPKETGYMQRGVNMYEVVGDRHLYYISHDSDIWLHPTEPSVVSPLKSMAAAFDFDHIISRVGNKYYALLSRNDPGYLMFTAPLNIGDTCADLIWVDLFRLDVMRRENITTPAGTYNAWFCTAKYIEWNSTYRVSMWFAPYVGPVKFSIEAEGYVSTGDLKSMVLTLQSYSE